MTVVISENKLGKLGEEFVKNYCKTNNIPFRKASKLEDLHWGIDCFINEQPTDIKNTKDIYLLQILSDGLISLRHPFRETTKATHYCFVNVSDKKDYQNEWVELIKIDTKLERDFIETSKLWELKKYLYSINGKHWKDFHQTLAGACLSLKKRLLTFCKTEVYLRYGSVEHSRDNQIFFKMTKEKSKEPEKLNIDTIKNARERIEALKEKMKTIPKTVDESTKSQEEELIKIVI